MTSSLSSPRALFSCAVLVACGCLLTTACGADRARFEHEEPEAFGDAPDASREECTTVTCSRDLHSVLSGCTGEVLRECPDDTGCAEGKCVPACASAENNQGTIGCSFWTVPSVATIGGAPSPVRLSDERGSCFAAFVANTWTRPVTIEVEYEGARLDLSRSMAIPRTRGTEVDYEVLSGPLPPGEIAVVFLHQSVDPPPLVTNHIRCPLPAAIESNAPVVPVDTGKASAFRITTDLPVSAYSMFPYGGALSYLPAATVLLPTSSWDTRYLVVNAWDAGDRGFSGMKPTLQIIAAEDDTEVRIRPNDDLIELPGGTTGVDGRTKAYKLAKGELLQFTQARELAGSPIESDKPIGVFGGSTCSFFPSTFGTCCCDVNQQQIPPVRAWGNEYAAVQYESRRNLRFPDDSAISKAQESVPWRLFGAANDTTLTYEPSRPEGAPRTLAAGEAVTFWTDKVFVVKSQDEQHPFFMAAYMTSESYGRESDSTWSNLIGDPDFVNVVPTQQYLDSYVFYTDMTYSYTMLVLVRRDRGAGMKDVVLDCAGPIEGWRPLDADGKYEYARVTMVRNGAPQAFAAGKCENGRHEIHSDEPFALTVWGLGEAASYGYPGGAGLRAISPVQISVPR